MRLLITGADSFTARYLVPILQSGDDEIFLSDISESSAKNYYKCDLRNEEEVFRLIKEIKPEGIYNLAGSFTNDYDTDYEINVIAVENILDALTDAKLDARVLLLGSSAEYGLVEPEDNPIAENRSLSPVSYYGLTKSYQTEIMEEYVKSYKMDIVMARPFNLYGPGISEKLLPGRLYKQIDEYLDGKIKEIRLGSLDSKRDFINIEQAVKYYIKIFKQGDKGGIYNVGTGRSISCAEFVNKELARFGLDMSAVKEIELPKSKHEVLDIWADLGKLEGILEG